VRVRLTFSPKDGVCRLPVHYNQLVQGFLYRHLDESLAESVHNEGYVDGSRRLRMFTFSRLQGRAMVREGNIVFAGEFSLVVASPDVQFLESLSVHVIRSETLLLGGSPVHLTKAEVETDPPYHNPVLLQALSPITAYSTLMHRDGRRKTYYYTPWEEEFSELLVRNLQRKWRAYYGGEMEGSPEGAYVKPVRVNTRNLHVAKYKGTVIKGWSGVYEASLPEPLFRMALDAGLGSKNSQGFGCVGIYTLRHREVNGL